MSKFTPVCVTLGLLCAGTVLWPARAAPDSAENPTVLSFPTYWLQDRTAQLQQRLDDPNLYARDRAAFAEVSNSLAAAQHELAAAEETWLGLEILREEIEGQ